MHDCEREVGCASADVDAGRMDEVREKRAVVLILTKGWGWRHSSHLLSRG